MKRPSQLPVVLSREGVVRLLKVTYNLKHKALLMTAYSAGLRVGEAVRLKVSEIDSKRMQVRVTAGKGAKDRYTLLSETALAVLREYFRTLSPRIGCFRAKSATIIWQNVRRKKFSRMQRRKQASSSQRHFTPCAIPSPRIYLKTVETCGSSKNYLDTEVLRRPSGIPTLHKGAWKKSRVRWTRSNCRRRL